MKEKIVEFKGIVTKQIYSNGDFKIYSVDIDKELYPNVQFNAHNDVTITGNLHELVIGMVYSIIGVEDKSKYGYCYKVKNIKINNSDDESSTYAFLQGILTQQQADELYRRYPNIVNLVITGRADDIVDLSTTKGIKEKTFEVIKRKIVENYVLFDLIAEFNGLLTISVLRSIYEKYPSIEKIRELIQKDPYNFFTQLSRVGFKKADAMLLNMQNNGKLDVPYDLRTSKERCLSAVLYLLEENEDDGNTRMDIRELRNQINTLVPQCSGHFVDCLKSDNIYYDINTMVVARRYTYNVEKYIADKIKDGLKHSILWDIDVERYRKVDDYELTDEQMGIITQICNSNICVLSGSAGVGKSFSTSSVINMLEDNHKSYKLMSPTGKAAQVLREYTGRMATTIHIGLGYKQDGTWLYNEKNPLDVDIIIVDEFSMVDIFLFKTLLSAIDFSKTKLLVVGDNAQLSSVGAGNCLHNLIYSDVVPVTKLTKIFRYQDGGLMKVATDVRHGKRYLDKVTQQATVMGKDHDYTFIQSTTENSLKFVISLYKKLLKKYLPSDIMVLAAYNKGDYGTVVINKELQKIVNKNYGSEINFKHKNNIYYVGDIVLQTKNDYHAPVFSEEEDNEQEGFVCNGETGVIKKISKDRVLIEFDGVEYVYSREMMDNILLGYAMSIHKSQGSSSKVVIMVTPSAHMYLLSSNIMYVAMTRMKEKCYHIGDLKAVNMAIKKKVNLMRNTFLEELLTNQEV